MKRFVVYFGCLCVVNFCFLITSVEAVDVYKIINKANKDKANKEFSNDDERYKNALQSVYDYNGEEIKPKDKFDVFLDLYGTLSHWQEIKSNTYAESLKLIVESLRLMISQLNWPSFLGIADDEINELKKLIKQTVKDTTNFDLVATSLYNRLAKLNKKSSYPGKKYDIEILLILLDYAIKSNNCSTYINDKCVILKQRCSLKYNI